MLFFTTTKITPSLLFATLSPVNSMAQPVTNYWQGTNIYLEVLIRNGQDDPPSPSIVDSITCQIIRPNGTFSDPLTMGSTLLNNVSIPGKYNYQYQSSKNDPAGVYLIQYTATLNGQTSISNRFPIFILNTQNDNELPTGDSGAFVSLDDSK